VTGRPAPWATKTALALAREMWDGGELCADIAKAIGCGRHALLGYAHRHGWPLHPKQPAGAEWRTQRKAAQQPPGPVRHRKPAPPPVPAVAAPKPPRGPRREACNPEPLAVPTAAFSSCQWTDCEGRPWVFCGAATSPGCVYCAEHRQVAYYRARALPEVAA
jgi:hypothetical protein